MKRVAVTGAVVLAVLLLAGGCGEGSKGGNAGGLSRQDAEHQAAVEVLEDHGWNHNNAEGGVSEVEKSLRGE
jgi:major membrane immunogen (membrane-anchored lipoprotein)